MKRRHGAQDLAFAHRLADALQQTPPTRSAFTDLRRRFRDRHLTIRDLRCWRGHGDPTRIARDLLSRRWGRRVPVRTFANLLTRAKRMAAIRETWHRFAEDHAGLATDHGLLPVAYARPSAPS